MIDEVKDMKVPLNLENSYQADNEEGPRKKNSLLVMKDENHSRTNSDRSFTKDHFTTANSKSTTTLPVIGTIALICAPIITACLGPLSFNMGTQDPFLQMVWMS